MMKLSHHSAERSGGQRRPSRTQKGYILVMFALLLIPMLFIVGMSVDVGLWYNRAADMRKAADAGALAGVVWLPDENAARTAALAAVARNGFTTGGSITVDAGASANAQRRMRVSITDSQVGSFFYENLGGRKVPITRTSFAEYTLPVPMGSPMNYFGTGRILATDNPNRPSGLSSTAFPSEELYQSINTYCSNKVNGDRHQPMSNVGSRCSGTQNERKDYELYIEAKPGRPGPIDVLLLDPGLRPIRRGAINMFGTANMDRNFSGDASDENFTFSLYAADNTPLTDADNPLLVQRTYNGTTSWNYGPYLGSSRWNRLYTIPAGATSGKYILRLHNSGTNSPFNDGENSWGLVARYSNINTNQGLCNGRTDSMCPRVYGKDAISIRAAAGTSLASFYLAEIEGIHEGKILDLELFDPGEGGYTIEIMKPTGTNSWAPNGLKWQASGVNGGNWSNTVTSIDVTQSKFNGKVLHIQIPLAGYNPPSDNQWWKVRYSFSGSVTDRTTWTAAVLGDPVHLVDET